MAPKIKARSVAVIRDAAMTFLEADVDGGGLSYEEFVAHLPERMQAFPADAVKEAFDLYDADCNGSLSAEEFFLFMLSVAESMGTGLEAIFEGTCMQQAIKRCYHHCTTGTQSPSYHASWRNSPWSVPQGKGRKI